jgi:integrase
MKQIIKRKLPKKDRPKGLFLYCNTCKVYYADDRKVKCKCPELVYKALIHVSGTRNTRKSSVLEATNYVDALNEFYTFRENLSKNDFQKVSFKSQPVEHERLVECFAYYMSFLNNKNVPKHKQKIRDAKYVAKFELLFDQYQEALQLNGIDCDLLKFTDVNDMMVGFVHDYFLNHKGYANKTYNNNMALLSAFTSHVTSTFNLQYKNPFLGVPDMIVTPKTHSIRENEFDKLLTLITPENGIQMKTLRSRKNQKKTNHYKPWLKWAFRLGLFTGGRSEDIVELKWNDISLDEKGNFDTLKTIDYKMDSANSNRTSKLERLIKHFAITKELGELLVEMGYNHYKGSDKYIIAPEDGLKRSNISGIISRSFSHYYSLLNSGKVITFKNLRKTFMTSALMEFGAASTALTNHANISMTNKHYHDKEVTRDVAKQTFSVFKKR